MDFFYILLGSLIILSLFNVGEFVYNKIGISHFVLCVLFVFTLVLSFVPDISFGGYALSLVGSIIPLLLSIRIVFGIRSKKDAFSFIVSCIISCLAIIAFSLLGIESLELIQPYVYFSLGLGVIIQLFTKNMRVSFASMFFGLSIGSFIFFQTKFGGTDAIFIFGSKELLISVLCAMLAGVVISLFQSFYEYRAQKKVKIN